MSIKPLTHWKCDSCDELVTKETGWLEWIEEDDIRNSKAKEFHIVHNKKECFHHSNHPGRKDNHLGECLGYNGLQYLLEIAHNGGAGKHSIHDASEYVELIRRLHVPYYEEARMNFVPYAQEYGLDAERLRLSGIKTLEEIAKYAGDQ
ncbi:MAG: hypothetical protein AB1508_03490 [Pseudomonadota bacterium]